MKKKAVFERGLMPSEDFLDARRVLAAIVICAVLAVAGCAGPAYTEPKEVKAEAPAVSYKFTSDEDLVEAHSRARTYCSQYGAIPQQKGTVTENVDGTRTVNFECVATTAALPPPPPLPAPMSYTYRTDAELLQSLRSADVYCARSGQVVASTSIVTNPDGTKTLTFQCVPR